MFDLLNGQLDRYQLRERIGSGGMARVFKAWDSNLDRLVAIKILHEHLADDPAFKERFEREAKLIASINHPNIVQVYDFNVIHRDGFPLYYMVMPYVPGKTLREVLEEAAAQSQRLERERVLELVTDLTGALGYAHARGMVHRDVKPGNIILDENGQAILSDFGIARMVQSNRLTQDGVSTGTPIYMSPEQANGKPGDARSDLYSLGVIIYEMLAARPPFVDDNSMSVMLNHLNVQPPPLSAFIGITRFDPFVEKALAKDPNDRFQSAEALLHAFKALFDTPGNERTTILPSQQAIPIAAPSTGTTSMFMTISQKARENPGASIAVGAAVVSLIALLAILLISQRGSRYIPQDDPTAAPTAVVQSMTLDNPFFGSSFNADDRFKPYWSSEGTEFLTRTITNDGLYQMRNIRPFTAETSIFQSDDVYENMTIQLSAKLEDGSQPASGYGIVFRYHDEANYNVFAVDGMGRFSIWVRSDGQWRELRGAAENWTPHESIKPRGEDNTLSVTVLGDFITGYVNNQLVARVTDATLTGSKIGIYFATDDGEATVSVDWYQVFSSVPSMTGSSQTGS